MSSLTAILDAMAAALDDVMGPDALGDQAIQVVPRLNLQPQSPTSVDIYPGDPFRDPETAGFGDLDGLLIFTVRARVNTPDNDGAQDALLALMDDQHDLCLAAALEADTTLDGVISQLDVDGNTGFRVFDDQPGAMLGCSWRVRVINAESNQPRRLRGVREVRFPFTFATANLHTTGAVVTSLAAGDVLHVGTTGGVKITEAFDGSNPHFELLADDGVPANGQALTEGDGTIVDSAAPLVGGKLFRVQDGIAGTSRMFYASEALDIRIAVTDNGADPGSTQGAGEVVLLIGRA